jgi:glycosyltransferase involved in cell wall biosynthesis
MSPVGVCDQIGEVGVTHFTARSTSDWYEALDQLLSSSTLRSEMGACGRTFSLENYSLKDQADKLANALLVAIQEPNLLIN